MRSFFALINFSFASQGVPGARGSSGPPGDRVSAKSVQW